MANETQIKVTVEEKQALSALTKLIDAQKKLGDQAGKTGKQAAEGFSVFNGVLAGGIALKALSLLTSKLADTQRQFKEFSTAVAEVNTLLPQNAKLTKKSTDELIRLSSTFGTEASEQAKAYYQVISSGAASGAAAMELLASANTLAQGGLASVAGSVSVLTDIINVYGAENINAAEAADSLFTTVKLGKTTIGELNSSIGKVLPSAQLLGIDLDTVGAAMATMTTQGLSTAERTTQLGAIFTAVFTKSADAGKLFGKKVGDAFSITALKTKGLSQFLNDLMVATGGSKEVLSKLLGSSQALNGVFALTGKGALTLASNLEKFTEKAGASNKAAAEIAGSYEAQLKQASQRISNYFMKASEDANRATGNIAKVFNVIAGFFDKDHSFADEVFNTEGVDGLHKQIVELDKSITHMKEKIAKDEFFLGDITDDIKMLEEFRKKLEDVSVGQRNLVEQSSGGLFAGLNEEMGAFEMGGAGAQGAVPQDAESAPAVTYEREKNAILAELRAEQNAILAEENELKIQESMISDEAKLESLARQEQLKTALKANAELQRSTNEIKTGEDLAKIKTKQAEDNFKRENDLRKRSIKAKIDEAAAEQRILQTKQQIANNFMNAGLALAKEGSVVQKALLSAQAIMNTYVAATAALAPPPIGAGPLLGPILAASTIALGLANVAKINGAKFANGGFVGGASFVGDQVPILANSGEFVANRQQQANLLEAVANGSSRGNNNQDSEAMMAAFSQPIIVQVDGKEIARATREAIKNGYAI